MFVVGGVAGLLVVPLLWAKLPESRGLPAQRRGPRPERRRGGRADQPGAPRPLPARLGGDLRRVVHGPAARLRPQHLAAEDHGRGRLLHQGRHRPAPRAQRRRRHRAADRRAALRRARQQADRAAVVRAGRGLPRPAVDQAAQHLAGVRRGAARRRLRLQRAGARLRLRRPPLPAGGPRHRARHGGGRRPGRRDRRPVARRRAGDRRDRLPVGLLRLRGGRACWPARAGDGAGARRGAGRRPERSGQ